MNPGVLPQARAGASVGPRGPRAWLCVMENPQRRLTLRPYRTVEAHRQSIKRRLGIEGQAELIKYAV
jgi:hypothetical protein